MEGDQVTLQDLFVFNVHGTTANGSIAGALESTGLHPTFKDDFHRRGIALPADLFVDSMRARAHDRCPRSRARRVRGTGAGGTGQARLSLSPSAPFPQRQFTLELPSPDINAYDVQVTENGVPVIAHLTPIARNRVPLSIAVLLDTSNSMRGRPLSGGDRCREDADRRQARALGGRRLRLRRRLRISVHGWSASADAFDASLASDAAVVRDVALGCGRHGQPERGGASRSSRALVLLTDGDDTESARHADRCGERRTQRARARVRRRPAGSRDQPARPRGARRPDRRRVRPGSLDRPAAPRLRRARDRARRQYMLSTPRSCAERAARSTWRSRSPG